MSLHKAFCEIRKWNCLKQFFENFNEVKGSGGVAGLKYTNPSPPVDVAMLRAEKTHFSFLVACMG